MNNPLQQLLQQVPGQQQQTTQQSPVAPAAPVAPAPQQTSQQQSPNPLQMIMGLFGGGNQQPQPQPQPQQQQGGGGLFGWLGNLIMPILLIFGAVMILPRLFNGEGLGGLFDGIKNMFGGLFGGGDKQNEQQQTTGTAQNASYTEASYQSNPVNNVQPKVHDIASAAQSLPNDKSKAYWASVTPDGRLIDGNAVNVVGDTASTTKMVSAWLVSQDSKLSNEFKNSAEIKGLIGQMASVSSNDAADQLLRKVAEARGQSVEDVIKEYNQMLDQKGFKHLEIANFSGLPTSEGGQYIYVDGLQNKGSAYELAVATQMFGASSPQIAEIFKPSNNQTGMSGVDALAVKTGTAKGLIDRDNGADKSATAYAENGSIAVIESRRGEWISTINSAINTLGQQPRFEVTDTPAPNAPANVTPALQGVQTQMI